MDPRTALLLPCSSQWLGRTGHQGSCEQRIGRSLLLLPGFEHFQGWGLHHTLGQPVPVSDHPFREEMFPISNLNLPWQNLKLFSLVPSLVPME